MFVGAIILDLTDEGPTEIGEFMVNQLVYIDQLEPEDKRAVLKALLLKRRLISLYIYICCKFNDDLE